MPLIWNRCQGEVWCKLNSVNLDHPHFDNMEGVYVIWHGGQNPHTVYVGQGVIRDRLRQHRLDPRIQEFEPLGLFVTWARVTPDQRDGVEAFFAQRLNPRVGEQHPNVYPIEENLPW